MFLYYQMCTHCVDKILIITYNKSMNQNKYNVFKIKGKKFIVKLDLNPITNEYEYHMYIRHLIMPEQAIAAYFQKQPKYITNYMTDTNYTVQI